MTTLSSLLKGVPGDAGKTIELWNSGTALVWRYADQSPADEWKTLETLANLKGDKGDSAYQVWLDDGNEGAEEDFLNSLKAADAAYLQVRANEGWVEMKLSTDEFWVQLYEIPIDGTAGDNAYVYIAYASDDEGTDFTTTFNAALDYIAIKSTTTEIVTPQASDFIGLWFNYKGAKGADGQNFSYDYGEHTPFVLEVEGATDPTAANGKYWQDEDYNEQPSYTNGDYWIWWDDTSKWLITADNEGIDEAQDVLFELEDEPVVGTYDSVNGTGSPVVFNYGNEGDLFFQYEVEA